MSDAAVSDGAGPLAGRVVIVTGGGPGHRPRARARVCPGRSIRIRVHLHGAADGDPARLQAMSARFSAPVLPGDTLRTSLWHEGDDVLFTTYTGAGTAVLTQGRAVIAGAKQ